MKSITNRQTPKKKHLIIGLIAVVIVVLSLFGCFLFVNKSPQDAQHPPTVDNTSGNQSDIDEPQSNDTPQSDIPAKTNTGATNTSPINPAITITASNQNGSIYQVRTLINVVVSDGTCTLTLTNGNHTVAKSSGVQANPSSSTCQGFDVPVSELSPGDWDLTVTFSNETHQAKTSKTVTIK